MPIPFNPIPPTEKPDGSRFCDPIWQRWLTSISTALKSLSSQVSSAPLSVPDYASVRAINSDKSSAYVTGYLGSAAPSGIAGLFVRDPSDSTTADNGGTVLVDGLGRRWKRVFDAHLNVKWFGAMGDNSTDDTAAIQAALNAAGAGLTVLFPSGSYIVSSSLSMVNGAKLQAVGDVGGLSGSAIKANAANYSNSSFRMFIKPSGTIDSMIFSGMRFLGGGNHFYLDLSSGHAYKIKWDDCIFQDALGSCINAPNSANGNGVLVCRIRGGAIINSGGISSSGPINATEIHGISFENLKGSALYVADTGSYPNLNFTFTNNRIEGLASGVLKSDFPVIQLDGGTQGARIANNYHENTFSTLLKATRALGIVYAGNSHTDSALVVGSLNLSNAQIAIQDNETLVGVTGTWTGTGNTLVRFSGNKGGWSKGSLYGKTSTADDPVGVGTGGITLEGAVGLYKAEVSKFKSLAVPVTTNTFFDLFTVTSGSSAILGSRAVVVVRALLLFDVIDSTAGANLLTSQEVMLMAWANAGGTMSGTVTTIASIGSANVTLRVKAGATSTSLTFEVAVTNASLAYNTNSKLAVLYSYLADENSSSGLSLT